MKMTVKEIVKPGRPGNHALTMHKLRHYVESGVGLRLGHTLPGSNGDTNCPQESLERG